MNASGRRKPPATLPDHLEDMLGQVETGRWITQDDAQPRMSVARFPHQPMRGAATYSTLGLSKVELHQTGGHIRQELLYAQEGEREPFEAAHLLAAIAEEILKSGDALLRGQVLGPAGPVLDGSDLEALLCMHPGYFPEGFDIYDDPSHDVPVALAMLVPISQDEVGYVRRHGWDQFVELIGAEEPNLLDWRRSSLVTWVPTWEPCETCGQTSGHHHLPDGRAAFPPSGAAHR